jgi:uncharacterized protein (DUF305 family)
MLQNNSALGTIPALLLALLLSGVIAPQSAVAQHDSHQVAATNDSPKDEEFARALTAGMDKMHREMTAPSRTGNPDVDFLASMIPHHAGAVEMARLVLIHGRDPLVRRLAEEIIASQQTEIAAMQARMKVLKQGPDSSPDRYPALGSTRGSAR